MHAQLRAAVEAGCLAEITKTVLLQQNNQNNDRCKSGSNRSSIGNVQRSKWLLEINSREKSTGNTVLHFAVVSYFHALKMRKRTQLGGPFLGNYYGVNPHYSSQNQAQEQQKEQEQNNGNNNIDIIAPSTPGAAVSHSPNQAPQQTNLKYNSLNNPRELAIIQCLLTAGADPELCNLNGLTPMQLFKQIETNQSYFSFLPDTFKFPLIATLVAAGDRSWEAVPIPCPGLGQAIFSVWQTHPEDLVCLVYRLAPKEKYLVQRLLLILQRVLPGSGNFEVLRMQILSAALA